MDAVYSSPSARCSLLSAYISADFIPDARLYEVNFGQWEGKTWDEITPEEINPWMDDFVNCCPPKGESMEQMNERVMEFWHELQGRDHQRVAVVTHGGVVRLILALVRGIALPDIFSIDVNYGEVFFL